MALIIDTGVLYAAMDRSDAAHAPCRALLERTRETLLLPSPILPEVDYWVGQSLGAGAMVTLLRDIARGAFKVEDLIDEDYRRIAAVLDRYADQKVGFVDAAVLAVAERFKERKLATLDHRHFRVLRPQHVKSLKLLP